MPENIIIFLLFTLLAAAISMVLFVQKNNTYLFQSQMEQAGFADHVEFAYQSAENILGIIAAAAVFIGAAGGVILIGFRNKADAHFRNGEKGFGSEGIAGCGRLCVYVISFGLCGRISAVFALCAKDFKDGDFLDFLFCLRGYGILYDSWADSISAFFR